MDLSFKNYFPHEKEGPEDTPLTMTVRNTFVREAPESFNLGITPLYRQRLKVGAVATKLGNLR